MNEPDPAEVTRSVREALTEDVGAGDLTAALISADSVASARIIAREPAVLCGAAWVNETFARLDPEVNVIWHYADGADCSSGETVCSLHGPARSLLTGERTALNFLQTLSATATVTAQFVRAVAGTGAEILDTRKTLPGLRIAQKYAVRCGGGTNHRIGLFDAILIKENHIAAARSISDAVDRAANISPRVLIEVEIETFEQLDEALGTQANRLLLDNFTPEMLREAVERRNAHRDGTSMQFEASGNITLDNVREYAQTGVDLISIGGLTKNVSAIDFSMLFS